jgi:hypothetical protein
MCSFHPDEWITYLETGFLQESRRFNLHGLSTKVLKRGGTVIRFSGKLRPLDRRRRVAHKPSFPLTLVLSLGEREQLPTRGEQNTG